MSDRHVALIVEDDPAIMEIEKALVLSLGHEPRCATTLEEARAELASHDICYALSDMQIPTHAGGVPIVGAGETLLGDLRKYDSRRNARGRFVFPVLVVSGYSRDPEFVSRMYEADASGFIAKPFGDKLELVLDKIRGALEKAGRAEHGACCARGDAAASAVASPATIAIAETTRRAPAKTPLGRLTELPVLERWSDLHVYYVDDFRVLVRIGRTHVRRTAIDFGEAHASSRRESAQWRVLIDILKGKGAWRWKSYGTRGAVKNVLYRLRMTLCAAFGRDDDPFHDFEHDWVPRFRAYDAVPEFENEGPKRGGAGRGWSE